MVAIYEALKQRGFRETYWQVVYPGQIGGLIKSPLNTIFEFHVRFFETGMIYAELEVGRSVLLHFFIHKYYLNNYIGIKVARSLTEQERHYFYSAVDKYKAQSIKKWPEWSGQNKFMDIRSKRIIKVTSIFSNWRILFLAMLISIAATYAQSPTSLALLAMLMILAYLLSPKRR
jgi:hypothetical protein